MSKEQSDGWYRSLNHLKSATAHKVLVKPADDNYILARWMSINGFYPEYFWQAAQAIEKYLKAGMLLNEKSIKKYGHGITRLNADHAGVFGSLMPKNFTKPKFLNPEYWHDETIANYIRLVGRMGEPDSRYGAISWSRNSSDLFKLDQVCWSLRRLTIGLDWIIGDDFGLGDQDKKYKGKTYKQVLSDVPNYLPRNGISDLDKPIASELKTRADILYEMNFELHENLSSEKIHHKTEDFDKRAPMASNSPLTFFWSTLNNKEIGGNFSKLDPVFREFMYWLLGNVKLDSEVKKEFEELLNRKR